MDTLLQYNDTGLFLFCITVYTVSAALAIYFPVQALCSYYARHHRKPSLHNH
jgi:hypothetical protein